MPPRHDIPRSMSQSSIRNHVRGTVKDIVFDKVVSEVIVETSAGTLSAVITTRSVEELGLKPGDTVDAIIKATNVSIERP